MAEADVAAYRRMNNDSRLLPGETDDDPMCVNFDCPSAFSCRRFSWEPYQGERGTIYIDGKPDLLDGLLCAHFDPDSRFFATPTHRRL